MILLAVLIRYWEDYQWVLIYSVAFLPGSFSSLYGPAALTLIRGVVSEKDLLYANSTADIVIETGSIVGMGLAGIFLAWAGFSLSMITGGVCFALAGLCFLFIRTDHSEFKVRSPSPVKDSVSESLKQSWLILKTNRSLRSAYVMQAVLLMMLMTIPVLLVPYAQKVLKAGVDDFSRMEALFSIGAVAGGVMIPYIIQKLNRSLTTGLIWVMMAIVFGLIAKMETLLLAEILYLLVGFGLASWAIVMSSAQEQTPVDHQGRLVSMSNGVGGMIVLILYFLLYSFGDIIPVQKLYYIEAGFCLFLIFLLILNPLEESPISEARLSPASVKMIHQEPES